VTRAQSCDCSGLGVPARAHKGALEEGAELRLVIPAGGAVLRISTLTSLHRFIPRFGSRQQPSSRDPLPRSGHRIRICHLGPGVAASVGLGQRRVDGLQRGNASVIRY
jgi:hypothetical protein